MVHADCWCMLWLIFVVDRALAWRPHQVALPVRAAACALCMQPFVWLLLGLPPPNTLWLRNLSCIFPRGCCYVLTTAGPGGLLDADVAHFQGFQDLTYPMSGFTNLEPSHACRWITAHTKIHTSPSQPLSRHPRSVLSAAPAACTRPCPAPSHTSARPQHPAPPHTPASSLPRHPHHHHAPTHQAQLAAPKAPASLQA